MATSQAFRVVRAALSAGVLTPIYPPFIAKAVSIGNATAGDVRVCSNDDEAEYVVIASGYERLIDVRSHQFTPAGVAFWLKATQSGTAVILWL